MTAEVCFNKMFSHDNAQGFILYPDDFLTILLRTRATSAVEFSPQNSACFHGSFESSVALNVFGMTFMEYS